MHYFLIYIKELFSILNDMAPWLIMGFLISGILHVFFPDGKVLRILGKNNARSVINASLIGVPLPLCSCGVIPAGISLYKSGASKGAATSFLISTPQTGVDSIMVTYSLLGLPFALIRPLIAFITGILGGFVTNFAVRKEKITENIHLKNNSGENRHGNFIIRILNYAFVTFLQDIAKWLVIGLLLSALIAVVVPNDFFSSYINNEFLGMLIVLAISLPLYVCATSSVPIAAALMLKGLSPGAAFVFLMAGPASNAATITVIGKALGKRTLTVYLFTLITGALLSGITINEFLPRQWFNISLINGGHMHQHDLLPSWLKISSGIIMTALLVFNLIRKYLILPRKYKMKNNTIELNTLNFETLKIKVKGMTCSHCKMNVENSIKEVEGVIDSTADINSGKVIISGNHIDLSKVKSVIENIGYTYDGII